MAKDVPHKTDAAARPPRDGLPVVCETKGGEAVEGYMLDGKWFRAAPGDDVEITDVIEQWDDAPPPPPPKSPSVVREQADDVPISGGERIGGGSVGKPNT